MARRIAVAATAPFGADVLERLARTHDVVQLLTRPDRPRGRGRRLAPTPAKEVAERLGIPVAQPARLDETVELAADTVVVCAYGPLIPLSLLERALWLNVHPSLLPRWRGAAPVERALMAGDAETGVMVMHMDEGLDTGPVLMAEKVAIGRKTSGELAGELSRLGADLMVRALAALERGQIAEQPQSAEGVTYAKKIAKDEARIDWSKSAAEIDCLVRGLSPSPGAFSEVKGERLKILMQSLHMEKARRAPSSATISQSPAGPAR